MDVEEEKNEADAERLEFELRSAERDFNYWQEQLKDKDRKKGDAVDPRVQSSHDAAKECYEKARQAVLDHQDPHEQISKKSAKADRLHRHIGVLEKDLQVEMGNKAVAERRVDESQEKIVTIIEKIL